MKSYIRIDPITYDSSVPAELWGVNNTLGFWQCWIKNIYGCVGLARECRYSIGDGNRVVWEHSACNSNIVEVLPFCYESLTFMGRNVENVSNRLFRITWVYILEYFYNLVGVPLSWVTSLLVSDNPSFQFSGPNSLRPWWFWDTFRFNGFDQYSLTTCMPLLGWKWCESDWEPFQLILLLFYR